MANKDAGKAGANGGADDDKAGKGNADPSKDAGNQDDKSGKGGAVLGGGDDGESGKKTFTQDELDSIVEKRLARAKKDAEADAKLSKEQLLEKERDDALSKAKISDARDVFISAATKDEHGLNYAQASKLFRYYRDDFEFDDKGKIENLKDVLKEARSEWPELFKGKAKPGGGDLGGGQGGGDKSAGSGFNDMIRRAAGRGKSE